MQQLTSGQTIAVTPIANPSKGVEYKAVQCGNRALLMEGGGFVCACCLDRCRTERAEIAEQLARSGITECALTCARHWNEDPEASRLVRAVEESQWGQAIGPTLW